MYLSLSSKVQALCYKLPHRALTNQRMTLVKMKPRTSAYTISRSSMVGCFAVLRARSLVHEPSTPARLRASIDPIDSRFDWCSMFVPHEPRGRTIRLPVTLRGTKKMISAPACSRTMKIGFFRVTGPDHDFLRRCALTFSPRGPDHAKRRGSDHVSI